MIILINYYKSQIKEFFKIRTYFFDKYYKFMNIRTFFKNYYKFRFYNKFIIQII